MRHFLRAKSEVFRELVSVWRFSVCYDDTLLSELAVCNKWGSGHNVEEAEGVGVDFSKSF